MLTSEDYLKLFADCTVTTDRNKKDEIDAIVLNARKSTPVYQQVEGITGVPWQVIAAIHFRESNQNFSCHLHNGDPLSARTTHVPVGRPDRDEPPFSWVQSATDALRLKLHPSVWDLGNCLEFIERYNGVGYQKHGVNTPYLWDYTNQYISGLYRSDGSFDPDKTESRPGAVTILKGLNFNGAA